MRCKIALLETTDGYGVSVHWPEIDEDLSTDGVLRGSPAPRGSAATARKR
jgi:hypothetical protein